MIAAKIRTTIAATAGAVLLSLAVVAPAQAAIRSPAFYFEPAAGLPGTNFTGAIGWFGYGDPEILGCSQDVTYTVTDPNGLTIAMGVLPANVYDPVTNTSSFSTFTIAVDSNAPVGTYQVAGSVCEFRPVFGSFDVVATTDPTIDLSVSGPGDLTLVDGAYDPNPFVIQASVRNAGLGMLTDVDVTLDLPAGLHTTDPTTVTLGDVDQHQITLRWEVTADPSDTATTPMYTATATATNAANAAATGHVGLPGTGAPCTPVAFIAAMGSDQHFAGATNLDPSTTLTAVYDGLTTTLGFDPTLHVIDYPATSVKELYAGMQTGSAGARISQFYDVNLPAYLAGKAQGVNALWDTAQAELAACPDQKLVLAGYSQGAMVMHEFLNQVAANSTAGAIRDAIAATVLVADPERVPRSDALNFGTARWRNGGICDLVEGAGVAYCTAANHVRDLSPVFAPRTVQVCDSGDVVCDTGAIVNASQLAHLPPLWSRGIPGWVEHLGADLKEGAGVHAHYPTEQSTRLAGAWAARQALRDL